MVAARLKDFKENTEYLLDKIEDNRDVLVIPRKKDKEAIIAMTLSKYRELNGLTES